MNIKYLLLLLILPTICFSKIHYAKVEPLQRATIKASTSGAIVDVNLSSEGMMIDDMVVIQIDDKIDKANLESAKTSLLLSQESLALNQEILEGLVKISANKKSHYRRVANMSTATKVSRDNAHDAYVSASNQLLSTKEKIINLKSQILELRLRIATLEDTIGKKSIRLKKRYLYKLMARVGDFAAPGMPLAISDDISQGKLVIFLDIGELEGIDKKTIYIDGNPTDMKFSKIWSEADEKYVSSYRAEIVTDPTYKISKLLKIEIK